MARRFAAWFAGHDVLVMPTLPTLPYETGAYARSLEGLRDEDLLVQAFRFMPYTSLQRDRATCHVDAAGA
jgi:Asp-tRNA(Asn)/Glu-tRNA(Gln) amidotransferase A subunit family amidase